MLHIYILFVAYIYNYIYIYIPLMQYCKETKRKIVIFFRNKGKVVSISALIYLSTRSPVIAILVNRHILLRIKLLSFNGEF